MATKITVWIVFALTLALAPAITTAEAAENPPPACEAFYFPPLPPNTPVGNHQVGVYDSPPARIELLGSVEGHRVYYSMLVNGKQIWDGNVPASMLPAGRFNEGVALYRLPAEVAKCVEAKNMPKPQCRLFPSLKACESFCQGQAEGLTVLVTRASNRRLVLLYAKSRGWGFCSAEAF